MQDRYRMIKEIGQGAYSKVFLVYDEKLAVRRVIKKISWKEAENPLRIRQQFVTEVHILNHVRQAGIPRLYDYHMEEDQILLVLEYIAGENLQTVLQTEGIRKEKEVLEWGLQLCEILRYLHERTPPILYLDLKPSNIMRSDHGQIFLIDFGVAQEGAKEVRNPFIQGTKGFAAPEQWEEHGVIDKRTDIYGFGKVLQFCLWGMASHVEREENPVAQDTELFLKKCTDPSPEGRYQNIQEVEAALVCLLRRYGPSVRINNTGRGRRFVLVISVAVGMAAVLFLTHMSMKNAQAAYQVTCAKEAMESEQVMQYYEEALRIAPWKEEIYRSMLEEYVLPDYFSTENAVRLLHVLEETKAMQYLSCRDSELYVRFCYEMGLGYFYHMGGIKGKQESTIWFDRALQEEENALSGVDRRRATCHREIGKAYQTFLIGEDHRIGRKQKNYEHFFQQLEMLLDCQLEEASDSAQRMRYEILTEISSYMDEFFDGSSLTSSRILAVVERIEKMTQKEEDPYGLHAIIQHIKHRIQGKGDEM